MEQINTTYDISMKSSSGNNYVLYREHIVFDVTAVHNAVPSSGTISSVQSIRLVFDEVYMDGRSQDYVEFTLSTYGDSTIADCGWDKSEIVPGQYTFNFTNLSSSANQYQLTTGSNKGRIHFVTDSERSPSFVFNTNNRKTAHIIVTYNYNPPTPTDASTLSLTTIPSEFGGTLVYSINGNSQCTHTLTLSIGSAAPISVSNVTAGSGKTITVPVSWVNQVPNSTTGQITVTFKTYYGSTQLGNTYTTQFTVSVPGSYVPSLSSLSISMIPIVDEGNTDEIVEDWGLYIQGLSSARLTANGASTTGNATISSYHFLDSNGNEIISKNINVANPNVYDAVLPTYTGKTFITNYQCYVVDSRGRKSTAVTCSNITVYTYVQPTISSCAALRCNSIGTISEDGTYFKISIPASFTSIDGKNIRVNSQTNEGCTYIIKWKTDEETEYSHTKTGIITGLTDSTPSTTLELIYGGDSSSADYITPNQGYLISISITDNLSRTTSKVISLGGIGYTMFFKKGGQGVALGQVSRVVGEFNGAFEVNPDWQMIWGYLQNNEQQDDLTKPIRIPGVIYTDKNTTLTDSQGRLGMIWLKET